MPAASVGRTRARRSRSKVVVAGANGGWVASGVRWVPCRARGGNAWGCGAHPERNAPCRRRALPAHRGQAGGILQYKRALLQGGEPSPGQLRELLRAVDAGEPDAVEKAWAFLHAQGTREAAARARTGLSPSEVRVIESMAADVAAARVFARPMGLGKLSEDLAAARNSLPPDRRAAVDSTLAALREDEARGSGSPTSARRGATPTWTSSDAREGVSAPLRGAGTGGPGAAKRGRGGWTVAHQGVCRSLGPKHHCPGLNW